MTEVLQNKFDKIEEKRFNLFNEVNELKHSQLIIQPEKDKWSILQIIAHLTKAEMLILKSIDSATIDKDRLKKLGFESWISAKMLNLALKSKLKFKAPPQVRDIENDHTLKELRENWDKTRKLMRASLDKFDDRLIKKSVFKHPYAGLLNISQTLDFINSHVEHHLAQIKFIKAKKL